MQVCLNTVRFEKSDDRSFVKFLIADNSIVINKRHTFYLVGLAPVTPQSYRAHLHAARALETTTDPNRKSELEKALLSKEQQTALARMKRYTDFNDLEPPRPGRGETPGKDYCQQSD